MSVLPAEDDPSVSRSLAEYLVTAVASGPTAFAKRRPATIRVAKRRSRRTEAQAPAGETVHRSRRIHKGSQLRRGISTWTMRQSRCDALRPAARVGVHLTG